MNLISNNYLLSQLDLQSKLISYKENEEKI